MAKFAYTAMDAKGAETTGVLDAESQTSALTQIREKGLFPVEVAEADAKKKKRGRVVKAKSRAKGKGLSKEINLTPSFLQRVKAKQLAAFTRQLSTLINAGMPLVRALQVLHRQERNPMLKKALGNIGESIESGSTFAEAIGQHSRIFDRLYVNMTKAGEVGGILDQVLTRLAEFMEKAEQIKRKVKGAMIYPIVVLVMAVGILTFLMVFIIPKFEDIFADLLEGEALPPLTTFVIGLSRGVSQQAVWIVAAVVALVFAVKLVGKTGWGRYALDLFKLNAPIFGTLVRKTAIARFSRTLGTLMASGVPVLQALNIVRDTAGNEVIARSVNLIHDAVKEGENMAPPIEASKQFPPVVISMVEVGEETGELPEMFLKIADAYDEEVDDAVAGLTSIIEPILIVFLAVVVGVIVIALFLPLISIIGKLS